MRKNNFLMSLVAFAFLIGGLMIMSLDEGYADDGSQLSKATFAGGCFDNRIALYGNRRTPRRRCFLDGLFVI